MTSDKALQVVATFGASFLLAFTPALSQESAAASACGGDVRLLQMRNVSDYYPKHPQCSGAAFEANVEVVVALSGAVESIRRIRFERASVDKRRCITDMLKAQVGRSAVFSNPPSPCIYQLRIASRTGVNAWAKQ